MISIDIKKKLKAWHGQHILQVKTQVLKGSITKVYGPSGSGKTTFLKVVAGLVTPEEGLIRVDNALWLDTQAGVCLSPQKRKTGFVFQNYSLFPNMTVLQHLQYATDDAQWINKLLEIGKLDSFVANKPEYLSGGQQQRLAILRAMAIKPAILLMDEPFSAIDDNMKTGLLAELQTIWAEMQTTVIIVSHHLAELQGLCNQDLYIGDEMPL